MAFVDCTACADRYRRHWIGVVFAILLSPLFWAWAALAALGRSAGPAAPSVSWHAILHLRKDDSHAAYSLGLRSGPPGPAEAGPPACRRTELWIGPESDHPLVQVAFHAVLQWLRGEVSTPRGVLTTFSHPAGPLGAQLAFVGSLLHDPETPWPSEPSRLWWWVTKAAYYRRWLELTQRSSGRRRRA